MREPGQPRFLVLEGPDGSGTTTQARLLSEALRARGLQVCPTAEPSDGPIGRLLRDHVRGRIAFDPLAEALAFSADRADHLTRVIRPALRSASWVVCDRYLLSTLAYQGVGGVPAGRILDMSDGFDVPDLTVVLDVEAAERSKRRARRGEQPERYDDQAFQDRLEDAYRSAAELLRTRGHGIVFVPGGKTPQDTCRLILSEVDGLDESDLGC